MRGVVADAIGIIQEFYDIHANCACGVDFFPRL